MKRIIYGSLSVLTAISTAFVSAEAEVLKAKRDTSIQPVELAEANARSVISPTAQAQAAPAANPGEEMTEEEVMEAGPTETMPADGVITPIAPASGELAPIIVPTPAQPGLTAPGLTEPELGEPELIEPEVTEPGLTEPGLMLEPDMSEPEMTAPGMTAPGLTPEPEMSDPSLIESDMSEPDMSEPDMSEPDMSEPDMSEPDMSEPDMSEPDMSEPDMSEPPLGESELDESEGEEELFEAPVDGEGLPPVPQESIPPVTPGSPVPPAPGFPSAPIEPAPGFPSAPVEPTPLPPLEEDAPLDDSAVPGDDFPVGASSSDRLIGEGFTPFQLSYLAISGGLKEEGIPGGSILLSAYSQGDISAADIVDAGSLSNRLGTAADDQADYTDGVDRFLELLERDARND